MDRFTVLRLLTYEVLLATICVIGDGLLNNFNIAHRKHGITLLTRALTDSATHGLVGLMSWCIVIDFKWQIKALVEVLLCGFLASFVDIDRFISAGTLSLQKAMSLPKRPPFHNSTLVPIITVLLFAISRWFPQLSNRQPFRNFTWIFFIAWTSHHIRDATRRGLWFAPFGSTPPIPKVMYILTLMVLPVLTRFVLIKTGSIVDNEKPEYRIVPEM